MTVANIFVYCTLRYKMFILYPKTVYTLVKFLTFLYQASSVSCS